MTSQSENLHTEALSTCNRVTHESWQQELATLQRDNEQLKRELMECRQSHQAAMHQLNAELEARFTEQLKAL